MKFLILIVCVAVVSAGWGHGSGQGNCGNGNCGPFAGTCINSIEMTALIDKWNNSNETTEQAWVLTTLRGTEKKPYEIKINRGCGSNFATGCEIKVGQCLPPIEVVFLNGTIGAVPDPGVAPYPRPPPFSVRRSHFRGFGAFGLAAFDRAQATDEVSDYVKDAGCNGHSWSMHGGFRYIGEPGQPANVQSTGGSPAGKVASHQQHKYGTRPSYHRYNRRTHGYTGYHGRYYG